MNLFTLAPKELTNSAIWAWILHGLRESETEAGPRRAIAINLLNMMDIPIPEQSEIHEIQTEKCLPTLQRPKLSLKGKNRRIDVFLRTQGNSPFVLFIENKVVEQDANLPSLLEQIEGYYKYFLDVSKGDFTYCQNIYPAYFGYETDTEHKLLSLAKEQGSPLANQLRCFHAEKMLKSFEGTGFEADPILRDFHSWLTSRFAFIKFRSRARSKQNVLLEDVINASRGLGFGHLLDAFYTGFKRCSPLYSQITNARVDIRNINFFKGSSTPLTLRWYYNSGSNGLYVGIHEDFERMTGLAIDEQALPKGFAWEKEVNWCFGYFQSAVELDMFWKSIVRFSGDKDRSILSQELMPNEDKIVLSEIDSVFALARQKGLQPKRWGGSRLKTYNGFEHDQRVHKWQALDLAVRMGLEEPAENKSCSICGASGLTANIAFHSEDYGSMSGHHALCKSCHSRVHRRFGNPQRWQEFIAPFSDGTKWFESISMADGSPSTTQYQEENPQSVDNLSQVKIKPEPTQIVHKSNPLTEMQQLRIDFVKAMGIKSQEMNPSPMGGYKLERKDTKRAEYLQEARSIREQYADLVRQTGRGRDILQKMDSNLANRDRGAVWRL